MWPGSRCGLAFAVGDNAPVKAWTDDLPQIPFPYRGLPAGGPWLTQEEAAAYLGIGPIHLNALTSATHRIEMVRTTGGGFAVTRAGVEAEKDWRTSAGPRRKTARLPWTPPSPQTSLGHTTRRNECHIRDRSPPRRNSPTRRSG